MQLHQRVFVAHTGIELDKPDTAISDFAPESQFCQVCDIAAGVYLIWRTQLPKVELLTAAYV